MIVGSILLGADQMIGEFVAARIPHMRDKAWGPMTALGVVRNGYLLGGVVYHGYLGHDVQVSVAFDHPGWCLPRTMRALFHYPFNQLGVRRMTAIVGRKNKRSRRLTLGMGFRLEGVHPKGIDGIEDAMSYGMLKEHCKWIKDHGQQKFAYTADAA